MGDLVRLAPKTLVDFEKNALRLVAASSRFMVDIPAAMRVARAVRDDNLLKRIEALVIPLSALAGAINLLESHAPEIVDVIPPHEPIVLHVENAGESHNVSCHATVRENVIYVSEITFEKRDWLDRLTQSPPALLLEFKR